MKQLSLFEQEIWKPIPFLPDYQISTNGDVKGLNGDLRVISFHKDYPSLRIKGKDYSVHRLVAQTFIPNPENKLFVNHIDQVKHNCNIHNLEWVTASENMHSSRRTIPPNKRKKMKPDYIEGEIWKMHPEYHHIYVSTLGRLITTEYLVISGRKRKISNEPMLMLMHLTDSNYYTVTVKINGVNKTTRVHRLVAQTFIPNPMNYPSVNHINSIKNDNRLINLEWVTPSQNSRHSYEYRLSKSMTSQEKKLVQENILNMWNEALIKPYTKKELSDKFNMSYDQTKAIFQRQTWTEITKHLPMPTFSNGMYNNDKLKRHVIQYNFMDDLDNEKWVCVYKKSVNRYYVSNYGRCKRRRLLKSREWTYIINEYNLKGTNRRSKGLRVRLGNIYFIIHVEVAKAFLPNPNNCSHSRHIDGNHHNNHVENLEWIRTSKTKKI